MEIRALRYLFPRTVKSCESCAFSTSDQIVFPREIYLKIEPYNPMILSPMNINPDSHSRTIWKSLVLRVRLGTLGDLSESFRTTAWLKNIALTALGYLLTFLGEGTWLKSIVLKERLTIPDYLLHHPVWIHFVVPTANWESNHSPLGVAYDHQATTPSVSLLGSRLAARLARGGVLGCMYTYRFSVSETQVLELLLWRISIASK